MRKVRELGTWNQVNSMLYVTKGRELTRKSLGTISANSLSRSSVLIGRSRRGWLLEGMLGKATESEANSLATIVRKLNFQKVYGKEGK